MITSFLRKYIVYAALGVVVAAGGAYVLISNATAPHQAASVSVATTTPANTVEISGHVRAAEDVDLAIKTSGRVTSINYKVGDAVSKGDVIVATDDAGLQANLQQAEATLAKEQTALDQLTTSARPEDVAIAEQQVQSASALYDAANDNMFGKVQSAYTAADDAIRNQVDQFIYSPTSASAQVNFPVTNQNVALQLTNGRYALEPQLVALQGSIPTSTAAVTPSTYAVFKTTLDGISAYLNLFANAINAVSASPSNPAATIAAWRASIAGARTEVTQATQDLVNAYQAVITAQSNLSVAQNQLAIKQTGGSQSDIKAQQAVVLGAQAQVNNVLAQIADTEIVAPFDGTVTRQDTSIGETIQTGNSFVSVISSGPYQIEAYIPEVSVSQVAVGDKAAVTLDALGPNVTFNAEIISLDLSESTVDGVPSYRTLLQFLTSDDRIRSGMTANVGIAVANAFGNVPVTGTSSSRSRAGAAGY